MPVRKEMQDEIWLMPLRVIAWYLGVGALWILLSDRLLGSMVRDPELLTRMEILKGWLFLLVTSWLLLALIRRGLALISRQNEQLASSESRYRQLFDEMQNGFALHEVICSASGEPVDLRFLQVNRGFEKITGLDAEHAVGRTLRELLPGIEPFWIAKLGKVALTGEPDRFEGQFRGKYFEVNAYSTEPGRFAMVLSDVTAQRLAEMELKRLYAELEGRVAERTAQYAEANTALKQEMQQRQHAEEDVSLLNTDLLRQKTELEAVNGELEAFSFSVSHDLRAPLRRIRGFTRILQEEYRQKLDAAGEDYLVRIGRSCDILGRLIYDLLELARISRSGLHLKKLDLSRMAQEIAGELQLSEPSRRVTFCIADGIKAVGDETLVRLVLSNLLGNAYKYTGKTAGARIEFSAQEQEGGRVYVVRDNGAGFDMRYVNKLFAAFQRLHRSEDFEGTGVGLAIVQRIIHRHGGLIRAEAEPGMGASFFFTLGEGSLPRRCGAAAGQEPKLQRNPIV
jgi:PAS domain S-box-containing protein